MNRRIGSHRMPARELLNRYRANAGTSISVVALSGLLRSWKSITIKAMASTQKATVTTGRTIPAGGSTHGLTR